MGDAWDAFDAKMFKTKKAPVKKDVHNQFLELSASQNKSLNVADEDFSALSFQDAKGLIDKDENERLQFMNSNLSFRSDADGIEQMEAPSLLSVTNYFQQGSSFPVPYVGNDSTMFGDSRSILLPPTTSNDASLSRSRSGSRGQSLMRLSRNSRGDSKTDLVLPPQVTDSGASKSNELSRNDSLARFFLGSQSDGLGKADIMDYVLDYCKRRSSIRLDDSDIGTTSLNNSSKLNNHSSSNTTPERHDSGIGADEKAVINKNNLSSRSERNDLKENARSDRIDGKELKRLEKNDLKENVRIERKDVKESKARLEKKEATGKGLPPRSKTDRRQTGDHTTKLITTTDDHEESSIMISNGTSAQENSEVLNISDVGSIEGFEKFKKNLHLRQKHRDDRYRAKIKHHEDFEKKRLNVDERYSHPKLSPVPLAGPGATATLERPKDRSHKKVSSSSSDKSSLVLKQSNISHSQESSVVPVIHSGIQQQQQQLAANQVCTCAHHAHQCGQQPAVPYGFPGNAFPFPGGMPIAIHIHFPSQPTTTGTVVHPVPTTSIEHSKMQ